MKQTAARNGRSPRALVAMSGGVDSSLTAALLQERGYEVIGATIKTFCYQEVRGPARMCCGLEGIADARAVASTLGIPHYVFDLEDAFTRDVIDDFVDEYARGHTPVPCVRCNSYTKFRDLVRRARMLDCDRIATGHYARVDRSDGRTRILRAADPAKDQTYFLWGIDPEVLPMLELPIGELSKPEVRRRAAALGLRTADKPESFEICFVPDGDYAGFLAGRLGRDHPALRRGPIVDLHGVRVGTHEGYARYTIGQRKGLPGGFPEPMYVVEIRPETRTIVIGPIDALRSGRLRVGDLNWLADPPGVGDEVEVQIRHRAPQAPARVERLQDDGLELRLFQPQRAITPGQSAVLYRDRVLLGGGRIRRTGRPLPVSTSSSPAERAPV